MPTFRLDRQPWIPVVNSDGAERGVNLIEVFEQAPRIQRVGGTPLEAAALMRFLLALAQVSENPDSLAAWKQMWDRRPALLNKIVRYISENAQAWDLYSDDLPFLQSAELRKCARGEQSIEPTFLDRSKIGRDPHLDHSGYMRDLCISSAAAARALLVVHCFCMGGMGTPNPLIPIPPRSKDLDKFSSSSIAAQSCVAFLEAACLQDSLLLNLMAGINVGVPGWKWPTAKTRDKVPSTGVADNYSRPARTVLLYPSIDGANARSAFVTSGGPFADGDAQDDPLIPHRKAKDTYLPFRYEPDVALWRSANVLLSTVDKPIRVVEQLSRLCRRYDLGLDSVSLRVLGIAGKLGQVKHYLWRDEALPFGFSVIADDRRYAELQRAVESAKGAQQKLERRLWIFARSYLGLDAKGKEKGDPKKEAEEVRKFLGELVGFKKEKWGKETVTIPLYTDLWSAIAADGERIACDDFDEGQWATLLKRKAEDSFRRAIDRLPPDARRYRAEFQRRSRSGDQKSEEKKGDTV